jgi:hypothetical protein
MKYLRALKGLEPGIYFSLWMSANQVAIGIDTNLDRLGLEAGDNFISRNYFTLSAFYLSLILNLIILILNIKPKHYDLKPEMGELQLRLPLTCFSGMVLKQKSKRLLLFEIW